MSELIPPLRHVVRRSDVGETGMPLTLQADEAARPALAEYLDIPEVAAFTAQMTVERWRRDGLVVRGKIEAEVVQTCVVTLQPVRNSIQEHFEDYFAPRPESVHLELEGPQPEDIEPLVDERLDAGALAVEHLVLALDPYPRCEGVAFDISGDPQESEDTKPFASLAVLRKGRG